MVQQSVVHHRGGASTKRRPSSLVTFYQERNRLLNCLLFYEPLTLLALLPYFAVDAVAKILLSLAGKGKSFLGIVRGYLWLLMHIRWVRDERRNIQGARSVTDATIMCMMTSNVTASPSVAGRIVNRISRAYAMVTRLASYD